MVSFNGESKLNKLWSNMKYANLFRDKFNMKNELKHEKWKKYITNRGRDLDPNALAHICHNNEHSTDNARLLHEAKHIV